MSAQAGSAERPRGPRLGNDNVFEGNLIEHVAHEMDDSGAFYSCGQQGTSYVQRGNIIRNSTFQHVRMRDRINLGNPVISGIYLDDGMTGWRIHGPGPPPRGGEVCFAFTVLVDILSTAISYWRAGRLTAQNGGFRAGQIIDS